MNAPARPSDFKKQHLIDPEICIRCNTCEATCPVGAVTHDDANYVVDADKCNYCMDCIAPCPTGSIDNWRVVKRAYSLDEQLGWTELPRQEDFGEAAAAVAEAIESEVGALLEQAHAGSGGKPVAPASASKPSVNLFTRGKPAIATVQGNYRITARRRVERRAPHRAVVRRSRLSRCWKANRSASCRRARAPTARPHDIRLYSIASARDGEKRNANNVSLTVKRAEGGVASNYLCDLKVGDKVQVTGPFGATFLMPNDPHANILMICTGTGSAPFRAFTERRRRAAPGAPGKLMMFFGARTPQELPYFGPLQKVPDRLLEKHLVFSRLPGKPKEYVQDRMRAQATAIADLLQGGARRISSSAA